MPTVQTARPSRPPIVLIVNDQEWAARSLESILGPNGYAVVRAYNGHQALELARDTRPDLVILDYKLPDLDGIDVCEGLRKESLLGVATPIVIVTASAVGRPELLRVLAAGAWDFHTQPIDGDLFLHKLATFVAAKRDADRVREESLLDQLTGLYSLRGLAYRAREIAAEALRHRQPLASVCFSADANVATIDPKLLDEVALRVVEHLGHVCRKCGRVSDAVGRLNPRDFAILAPSTERTGAVRLVERLQQSLDDAPFVHDGKPHSLRLRAGYAAVSNYAEASLEAMDLVVRAETALRHSRRSGETMAITAFEDVPATPIH